MAQSVEPQIADLANGWLKQYKLDYRLEQQSLNSDIDNALNEYYSKQGGVGGNRPDCKLLLQDRYGNNWPVLIEYKGYKDKLVKLDGNGHVANRNTKGLPDFKYINAYAVNGAVHYANALLHYTSYTDVIAIGITGHKETTGKLRDGHSAKVVKNNVDAIPNNSITEKILTAISEYPNITKKELATICGITEDGVDGIIWKLKQMGIISRVGPNEDGYWKVV